MPENVSEREVQIPIKVASEDSAIYTNVRQDYIVTTEDKLKLFLVEHKDTLGVKSALAANSGMFLTALAALFSVDENTRTLWGISSDILQVAFVVATVWGGYLVCGSVGKIASVLLKHKTFTAFSVESMIDRLKNDGQVTTQRQSVSSQGTGNV